MSLKIGDQAPKFELKDQNGRIRSNKNLRGKNLILFFYPKDETPGCTAEACSFRDNYSLFQELKTEVWGVSSDNKISHSRFSEKYALQFPLLIDEGNSLRKNFGVQNSFGFLPSRVTYIINKEGEIVNIFNNLLNGPAHVENSLQIVKAMQPK